ncbi:MAG: ABC transporter permease [Bacilli bacterium]|nr:ABC transporter permease [Bacilli bacterium]
MKNLFSRGLPFHIVKRLDMPKWQYWLIKVGGFIAAFILSAILCNILSPGSFGIFFERMAYGVYNPKDPKEIFDFLETAGLLILVAFALAPSFKMKFWNIGAEGQISIGCLITAGITHFMANGKNDPAVIIVCLIAAILGGIIWAVIPAIFKAFFNTNETLFTLMMNYVAIALISVCIAFWFPNGSQTFPYLDNGGLPAIFTIKYLFSIIIIVVVVTLMIIYLKKTKHGYELSVVGASVNTARYVGINVKKVIIRTLILSGAISGLVGFLLVAGHHHSLTATLADGRGFTGVLIAWLGQFQPGQMILYGFLVAFFQRGSTKAASYAAISKTEFSAIVTGMFFLIVIATEFFVNYRIVKNQKNVIEEDNLTPPDNNQPNNAELSKEGSK